MLLEVGFITDIKKSLLNNFLQIQGKILMGIVCFSSTTKNH